MDKVKCTVYGGKQEAIVKIFCDHFRGNVCGEHYADTPHIKRAEAVNDH